MFLEGGEGMGRPQSLLGRSRQEMAECAGPCWEEQEGLPSFLLAEACDSSMGAATLGGKSCGFV